MGKERTQIYLRDGINIYTGRSGDPSGIFWGLATDRGTRLEGTETGALYWELRWSNKPEGSSGRFFFEEELTVGRVPGKHCAAPQWIIGYPDISQRHCRFVYDPRWGILLEDLNSRNGTFINGQRVQGSVCVEGEAELALGHHAFHIYVGRRYG